MSRLLSDCEKYQWSTLFLLNVSKTVKNLRLNDVVYLYLKLHESEVGATFARTKRNHDLRATMDNKIKLRSFNEKRDGPYRCSDT